MHSRKHFSHRMRTRIDYTISLQDMVELNSKKHRLLS